MPPSSIIPATGCASTGPPPDERAIEKTNEHADVAETGRREGLWELTNYITAACDLNPDDYGDEEDPASKWREW